MEKGSVAICFVHHAISGLRSRGIDAEPVLRAAGIAPAMLAVPQARVSAASYGALWLAVSAALGDEFFGQDSRAMKPGSFALLCHAVAGSRTLGQGLDRVARGFGVLLDDIGVQLLRRYDGNATDGGPQRAALVLTEPSRRRPGVFAQETLLIMLHGLMCWLARRRVPVLLPVALDQTYDYLTADEGEIAPGSFVQVPFGSQVRTGVVWYCEYGGSGMQRSPHKL